MQVPYDTPLADLGLSVKTFRTVSRDFCVRPNEPPVTIENVVCRYANYWADTHTFSRYLCSTPGIGPWMANEIIQTLENAGWPEEEILAKAKEERVPHSWEK